MWVRSGMNRVLRAWPAVDVLLRGVRQAALLFGGSRFLPYGAMMQTPSERLALRMLAFSGRRAIWDIHMAASTAHRLGRPDLAESLIGIAVKV